MIDMNAQSLMNEQKSKLRAHFRRLREEIGSEERAKAVQSITDFIVNTEEYKASEQICSFMSFGSEVSTELLHQHIHESGKTLLLPRISGKRKMEMIPVDEHTQFEVNAYGIKEPIGIPCQMEKDIATLCIVPLLSFDDYGHRLGYGGGFYDVFLHAFPHVNTIGIAFSQQYSTQELPHEEHDIKMNMIITESGIHPIKKKAR